MREYTLGRMGPLRISAHPSALAGLAGLWAALAALGALALRLPLRKAIAGGLVAALLHYASDLWHSLGHAWAAARTGHPMSGIHFWGALATCVYPPDEPELPAETHVRRALGGPLASSLLAGAAALFALAMRPGAAKWLARFLAVDNLLVFVIGALTPMKFTDGGTLRRWWRR